MKEKYLLLKNKHSGKTGNHFLLYVFRLLIKGLAIFNLLVAVNLLLNTGMGQRIAASMQEPSTNVDEDRVGAGIMLLLLGSLFYLCWDITRTLIRRNRYINELESLIEQEALREKERFQL